MQATQLPAIGSPFEGGFYAGLIRVNTDTFAIIAAPKAAGEHQPTCWAERGKSIDGARSVFDGRANTIAMAEAGAELAQWALTLKINGFEDWYLPARDELELCYRYLKPTDQENWVYRHGENMHAVPPTYAYTAELPAQTAITAFQDGSAEAFDDTWYWTSTQCSASRAWCQYFADGGQNDSGKDGKLRARAVRSVVIG